MKKSPLVDAEMIEIEFEEPKLSQCECCTNTTTRLTRYVYRNGDAFAAYYVLFTNGHKDKVAHSLIGLGEWGEDGSPALRKAFAVNIWDDGGNWGVSVTDKEDSPWSHVEFMGAILSRTEALQHQWIKDVFHITDHIVSEDKMVIEYFS